MKITQTFNPPQKHSFSDVEGMKKAYDSLHKDFSKVVSQLNMMKSDIERGGSSSSVLSIINQTVASGASSGSSTTTPASIQIRNRTESFTANASKHISFSSTIAASFSLSSIRVLDASGMAVQDFTITNLSASGFDFVCPVDGSLIYLAVEEV